MNEDIIADIVALTRCDVKDVERAAMMATPFTALITIYRYLQRSQHERGCALRHVAALASDEGKRCTCESIRSDALAGVFR